VGRIAVVVSPGAGRTELVGRHGEAGKVRVAAPPERGKANEAVVALLASALRVASGDVRIVGGPASRRKRVEVRGMETSEIERLLAAD
jgi:uncharacterized protein (TIGR00251 family)